MNTISSLEFAGWPDVILAQSNNLAGEMKAKWPDIPMIFTSHGILPEEEIPPPDMDKYIAISEEVVMYHKMMNVKLIRNFIDIDRFHCVNPIRDKPERLLFISNHTRWRTHKCIKKACDILKIDFRHLGFETKWRFNVEDYINEADIVVSLSRGILEAMSCERPVIVYEKRKGDGYIDQRTYQKSRVNNFSGRAFDIKFTPETLIEEILKYNPKDGAINREVILEHHNHIKAVDTIMEIIEEITG
jgi:hypothetical protein